MEPATYTLLGALGGILITQVANYLLESKKSKNQKELKSLELEHSRHHDLMKERRVAYSNYLKSIDQYIASQPNDIRICVDTLYSALIVAGEDTTKKINEVFSIIKKDDIVADKLLLAKGNLLKTMQNELQS